jgi:hypothetical protein
VIRLSFFALALVVVPGALLCACAYLILKGRNRCKADRVAEEQAKFLARNPARDEAKRLLEEARNGPLAEGPCHGCGCNGMALHDDGWHCAKCARMWPRVGPGEVCATCDGTAEVNGEQIVPGVFWGARCPDCTEPPTEIDERTAKEIAEATRDALAGMGADEPSAPEEGHMAPVCNCRDCGTGEGGLQPSCFQCHPDVVDVALDSFPKHGGTWDARTGVMHVIYDDGHCECGRHRAYVFGVDAANAPDYTATYTASNGTTSTTLASAPNDEGEVSDAEWDEIMAKLPDGAQVVSVGPRLCAVCPVGRVVRWSKPENAWLLTDYATATAARAALGLAT